MVSNIFLVFISLIFSTCSHLGTEIPKQNEKTEEAQSLPVPTPISKPEKKKISIWGDSPKMPAIPFVISGCESEYGCKLNKNEVLQEIILFKTPDLEGTPIQILKKGSSIVGVSRFLLIDTLPSCKMIGEKSKTIKFVHFGGEGAEYFWDNEKFINGSDMYSVSGKIHDCKEETLPSRKDMIEVEYSKGKFGWTDQIKAFEWFYP